MFYKNEIVKYFKNLNDNNIDYVILNSLLIEENKFNEIVDEYIKNDNKADKNTYTGFLYKESIFKVK